MAERPGLDGRDLSEWSGMVKRATREQLFKMIEECRHELNLTAEEARKVKLK